MTVKRKLKKMNWSKILNQALLFSAAPLIVFLTALQNGVPLQTAGLALYGAVINALINFLLKYRKA